VGILKKANRPTGQLVYRPEKAKASQLVSRSKQSDLASYQLTS
jgi:hypothetical protein